MQSTLKPRDSDPHDTFVIAPEVVPAAWADKVLADIRRDAGSPPVEQQPQLESSAAAGAAAPSVDTTFRATDTVHVPVERPSTGRWAKSAILLVFALGSAAAAAAWQNHGDAAKQMISGWLPAFALTSTPPTERTGLAGQADAPAAQASASDQTSPQTAAPTQPSENVAAAAAPSPESTQLQSMARDLAAMAQQVEQLKASIAELKISQQAMVRDAAKTSESKTFESKPAEIKPSAANARPRISPPPPRAAASPPYRALPAYPPAQAAAPAPLPQPIPPPASTLPVPPPPQVTARPDDEPIVRPPMPLR